MRRYRHVITVNRMYYVWEPMVSLFKVWAWLVRDRVMYVSPNWYNDI